MNIVFDSNIGLLYDFLVAILLNKNYGDKLEALKIQGTSYYKEIEEAYQYIWKDLDFETPGLEALTAKANGESRFFMKYFIEHLFKWKTVDVFIENFMQLLRSNLKYDILSYYDAEDHPREYYQIIANNASNLHNFVYKLEQPTKIKLDLIGIASGSEMYPNALRNLLLLIAERVNYIYNKNNGIIKANLDKTKKLFQSSDNFVLFQSDEFKALYEKSNTNLIKVTTSFLNPNAVIYIKDKNDLNVFFGISNKYLNKYIKGSIYKHLLFFKALSDESRIKIIELLREKEMYIGEISKALNIPLTTLTYHIKMLHIAEIIKIREEGKKTFCKFNPDEFSQVLHVMSGLSGIKT